IPGEVALAAVDVAYERLIRVTPANPAGGVHELRAPIRAELRKDLVLAQVDALVRKRHRRRGFLAAQRVVLVVQRDSRADVGLAEDDIDRAVARAPHLVQVAGEGAVLRRT